jgi:hypothetical protein
MLLATLVLGVWLSQFGWDWIRREQASRQLLSAIERAPTGSILDISDAYDLPWDRAVVVGPYWNGAAANSVLGFDHYPPDESLTSSDSASLLLVVRDRTVLSEMRLWQANAAFEDGLEVFTPEADRFMVERHDGWATLVPE